MPNIFQRIGSAFRPTSGKAASIFMWPQWRQNVPMWQIVDYSSYVSEGFNLNSLVYSSIMYKVRAQTAAPMRGWEGDADVPERLPAGNPLQQLLARPNPQQSFSEFHGLNVVYLNISGNSFIWLDRGTDEEREEAGITDYENIPLAMYPLRPDRMFIVPGKTASGTHTLTGFLYVPEGANAFRQLDAGERRQTLREGAAVPILPEDIMHVKLPNPADPLEGMGYGLSPLSACARNVDVDNSVTHFLQLFFRQGVMLPGVFKTTQTNLDDKTMARIKRAFKEMYGGYDRWAEEVAVLEAGSEYQRVGLTFEEMGFETLDDRNESRIGGPFGVPLILINSRLGLNRSTYANYKEARQAFWDDTMVPENRLFEVDARYYVNEPEEGWFPAFDYSRVPAFREVRTQEQAQYSEAFKAGAVTRNEYRRKLGLDPVVDGDVYVMSPMMMEMPVSLTPREAGTETTEEEAPAATDEERKAATWRGMLEAMRGKKKSPAPTYESKQHLYKAIEEISQAWEPEFGEAGERALEADRRALLAILSETKRRSLRLKRTPNWKTVETNWDEYFSQFSGEQWRTEFMPVVRGLIEDQTETLNAEFGMQFDVRNLWGEQWFDEYKLKFAQDIVDTTKTDVSKLLQQAMENGWTVDQMTKQLDATWQRYLTTGYDGHDLTEEERKWFMDRSPRYRRDNIARTETIRASNAGSWGLFKGWGAEFKEWLATPDRRTRPTHLRAWADYSEGGTPGPIPIDQPFIVGGEQLMFPGDPSGSCENVCQCRCTMLPFFPEMPMEEEEVRRSQEVIATTVQEAQMGQTYGPRVFEVIDRTREIAEAAGIEDLTLGDISGMIRTLGLDREGFIEMANSLRFPDPEGLADLFADLLG